jgi:hypothetical protein
MAVQLERILRQYGQSIESLRYSVGRERSLPCDKDLLRHCLIFAIAMSDDQMTRERLRVGYAKLEAFVSDEEFEVVSTFEQAVEALRHTGEGGLPSQLLREIGSRVSRGNERANAIQARIARQMMIRHQEVVESA